MGTPLQLRNSDRGSRGRFWSLKFVPRFCNVRVISRLQRYSSGSIKQAFKGSLLLCNDHLRALSLNLHIFSIPYAQMQFNQMNVPEEASVQVNKPMEQISNNHASAATKLLDFHYCLVAWEKLLQEERGWRCSSTKLIFPKRHQYK